MPEDNNNLDDLSIKEILNLYNDTLTTEDNIISVSCSVPSYKNFDKGDTDLGMRTI